MILSTLICDWCKDEKAREERHCTQDQRTVEFLLCKKCQKHMDFLVRENIAPWMRCGHQADEIRTVIQGGAGWSPVCSKCQKEGNEMAYFVDNERIAP